MISYTEYLDQEKRIYATANFSDSSDIIISKSKEFFPQWEDLIGSLVGVGSVVVYDGVKYLVIQTVTPTENQKPSDAGMLAIYKPYRDDGVYEWLSGEYVETGWIRTFNGVSYRAIQDPGANVFSPNLVPAIWEQI